MLRYFTYGYRDFLKLPDIPSVRYNWILLISFDGKLHPQLEPRRLIEKVPNRANFYIIPPDTKYVLVADQPRCFRAVFHFSYVSDLLRNVVMKRGILAKRLPPAALAEVRQIVRTIQPHYRKPTALSELYYEQALLRLTLFALEGMHFSPITTLGNIGKTRVEQAVEWFSEHIGESPSLSDVANMVHISPTQLRRHFYEEFGKSPKAVFVKLRMQRVSQLLATTSHTLERIAELCGFQSSTDLCRSFKKVFKVTPNRWRHEVNTSGRVDRSPSALDEITGDQARL